jgi:hypothetical protein
LVAACASTDCAAVEVDWADVGCGVGFWPSAELLSAKRTALGASGNAWERAPAGVNSKAVTSRTLGTTLVLDLAVVPAGGSVPALDKIMVLTLVLSI